VRDLDEAQKMYKAMLDAQVPGTAFMMSALIHGYYSAGKYSQGVERLRGFVIPREAQASWADLLRKAKHEQEASEICNRLLAATPGLSELHQHAYIVKIYLDLHKPSERQSLKRRLESPPFGPQSVHYVRLLCAKAFSGHMGARPQELLLALRRAQSSAHNSASLVDIQDAIGLIERKLKGAP
jgi:hypothetical protein